MTNEHQSLWDRVQKTDPKYTKQFKRPGGFQGTSINATYMAKQATIEFGPIGLGWGADVVQEDFLEGAPITNDGVVIEPIVKTIIHRVKVRLWYKPRGLDDICEIFHFGQTPFVYGTKYGPMTDEEAPKKSLTDGTNKCLSMLGFGGDIYLGLYDDQEYRQQVTNESLVENADDKDLELGRQQDEYRDWKKTHLDLVGTCRSKGELRTLHNIVERKMQRHNDHGGIVVLNGLKDERLEYFKTLETPQ